VADDQPTAVAGVALPRHGPFALRARVLTPLASGGWRYVRDGVVAVDTNGRITFVGEHDAWAPGDAARPDGDGRGPALVDVRPLVLLPGLVDLHAHLPQLPNAGLGGGLHLLDWLDRYIYPLERAFDGPTAARLAPAAFERMASAGTTTTVLYGAAWASSMDETFRAAEAHGIRLVAGRVMMDRICYRDTPPDRRLDVELGESAEVCERWHGRDDGRLNYAFTPRFAVSCSAELLRESAALARTTGAYWQTHLSEDRNELAEVAGLFPGARDYLDVYDLAGGLGPRAIMAHAIHLSDREIDRLRETGTRIAHCPESNLFLASGAMRLARYRAAGLVVGLGSDVAAGPSLSLFSVMRAGAYTHDLLRVTAEADPAQRPPAIAPLEWLTIATLDGARALGMADRIGTLEAGKEADLIAVDPRLTAPVPGPDVDEPEELMSRLMFRPHPEMVRAAWVRGRRLPDERSPGPRGSAGEGAGRGERAAGPPEAVVRG
jgi:guanine deaminase